MPQIPVRKLSDVEILYNNEPIGSIRSYDVKIRRKFTAIQSYGEMEPIAYVAMPAEYIIKIKQLYLGITGLTYADMVSWNNFTLTIKENGKSVVFKRCNWLEIDTNAKANDESIKSALFFAQEREVV